MIRINVESPVSTFVIIVGIFVFFASIFTSVYYFSISNYIFAIWAFLSGLLFFAICSGISEIIYILLELRKKIMAPEKKKEDDRW
jgi:magnesium-transporting ATPase (P-type)